MFYVAATDEDVDTEIQFTCTDDDIVHIMDTEDLSIESYTFAQVKTFPDTIAIENLNIVFHTVYYERLYNIYDGRIRVRIKESDALYFDGHRILRYADEKGFLYLYNDRKIVAKICYDGDCRCQRMFIRYAQFAGDLIHIRLGLNVYDLDRATYGDLNFSVVLTSNGSLCGVFNFYGVNFASAEVKEKYVPSKSFITKLKLKNNFKNGVVT